MILPHDLKQQLTFILNQAAGLDIPGFKITPMVKIEECINYTVPVSDTEKANEIIRLVFEAHKIPTHIASSKKRDGKYVKCRRMAITIIRENTELPLAAIGWFFGGRDHSTILHNIQTNYDLCETDRLYNLSFEECKKLVRERKISSVPDKEIFTIEELVK